MQALMLIMATPLNCFCPWMCVSKLTVHSFVPLMICWNAGPKGVDFGHEHGVYFTLERSLQVLLGFTLEWSRQVLLGFTLDQSLQVLLGVYIGAESIGPPWFFWFVR
jgi:hypothetical protein